MKYLQLQVGGKTLDLLFNMAAYRSIKESTGQDPLTLSMDVSNLEGLEKYGAAFFKAGLIGGCADKAQPVEFTDNEVSAWFSSLNINHVAKIINAFSQSCQVEADQAEGEAAQDTQE